MTMKITIATGIFPPDAGGPASYVERLSLELSRRNFGVSVITYSDIREAEITNQKFGFSIYRVYRGDSKVIKYPLYFIRVLRSAINSDVIYAQNVTSAGLPAIIAAKILRKRFIVKIVGDAAWERARERGITEDAIDVFQSKQYNFTIRILRKIQKYVAGSADKIIVPSRYLRNMVMEWGIDENKIYVIYNSTEHLAGGQYNLTKEEAKKNIGLEGDIILSIGRFMPWKGFGELIDTMPELLKHNSRFRLAIIGDGPLLNDLKLKVKNLGLGNSVILFGAIEHKKLFLYFKAADMFVLNSSYEGLPHVVLEAMAHDVPIIVTNVGGNPEVIEDNRNGFLVTLHDREELKEKIIKLWEDRDLRNKFVVSSNEKLKQFTIDKMLNDTLRVLTV